jgi:hypothetical protein
LVHGRPFAYDCTRLVPADNAELLVVVVLLVVHRSSFLGQGAQVPCTRNPSDDLPLQDVLLDDDLLQRFRERAFILLLCDRIRDGLELPKIPVLLGKKAELPHDLWCERTRYAR